MTLTEQLDKLKEQEWYQQIQNSYQQLPPEQQNYVKWGSLAAGLSLLLYFTFMTIEAANSVKDEYFQKQELAQLVNQGNDEIRRLKGQSSGFSSSAPQSWKSTFESLATSQGMSGEEIEIIKEIPGPAQNIIQETLLQVHVKGVELRPLVELLFQVEHGSPPMKLKGFTIESTATDGTLDAKINISGYMAKSDKEKSK